MTRKQFKQNLIEAIEHHDGYIDDAELEEFLDLNFDEDSSLSDWTWSYFNSFAVDFVTEGLRRACHLSDLKHWDDEDEDDEEDEE